MSTGTSLPEEHLPKYMGEDLSQECRAQISTLPTEPGWLAAPLYLYQGFWLRSRSLLGTLACQKLFQAQNSDVLLVTTPKSGTTWLKAIIFAVMKRSLYSPGSPQHPSLTKNPHVLVPYLEMELYADNKVPDLTSFDSPRLFSTHLGFNLLPTSVHESGSRLVYLCRDPKDTFISFWHFANRLRHPSKGTISLEDSFEKFCRGVNVFGPFWDHVLEYWKKSLESPEKVLFLKYEELKEHPTVHVKKLAEFLGRPFSPDEEKQGVVEQILKLCSFGNLSNLEVNRNGKLDSGQENRAFFRRGEVGDWKNYLTAEMAQRIDHLTEEKFHGSGLKF